MQLWIAVLQRRGTTSTPTLQNQAASPWRENSDTFHDTVAVATMTKWVQDNFSWEGITPTKVNPTPSQPGASSLLVYPITSGKYWRRQS